MSCFSCGSNNQQHIAAEMIIHFSGIRSLDNPGVWVFPKLFVCLDCGFSEFTVPGSKLQLLAREDASHETLSLEMGGERPASRNFLVLREGE